MLGSNNYVTPFFTLENTMINNIDYRIRRRNYLRHLANRINDTKLTLKKMEAQYEKVKRHSTVTKQK